MVCLLILELLESCQCVHLISRLKKAVKGPHFFLICMPSKAIPGLPLKLSALGKPRRLSEQLLQEERKKLEEYREHVRATYTELHAGVWEGLPTDLAHPLSVGPRVIAWHPKTRELHVACVLIVDCNKCRIQFDKPELGVELVMEILLAEMKNLQEEVPFSQNLRGHCQEYNAKILKQLEHVDDQVSYALEFLKDRNTLSSNGISPSVSRLGNNA